MVAALVACLCLGACGSAVYLADQTIARGRSDFSAQDRADLDAGNLGDIRGRYENAPLASLSLPQLALLCDVLLKYQELGRADDCLAATEQRVAADRSAATGAIAAALPGKRALLALALGQPETALRLLKDNTTNGGRYVYALASARTHHVQEARDIADHLRRDFDPAPVFYAASIYAAVEDWKQVRDVLSDPRRRLLSDYGVSGHSTILNEHVAAAPFRLDVFDEFDFGVFGKISFAPAANVYVEYLAALSDDKLGDTAAARRRLDAILAYPGIAAYRDVLWRALFDRARIARGDNDPATAESLVRRSIDVIEQVRGSNGSEAARIAVLADKTAPYALMVDLLLGRGDASGAAVYAERANGRVLVELLATRYRFDHGQAEHRQANALVASYDRAAGDILLSAGASQSATQQRLADLGQARRALQDGAGDVAELVTVSPVDMAAVQRTLLPDQAAILFFNGPDTMHIFTIDRDRVTARSVPSGAVGQAALRFRGSLLNSRDDSWQAPAAELYQSLIAPSVAGRHLKRLIVVPSGALHYIPFAALGTPGAQVVDQFALEIIPNLALLTHPPHAGRGRSALVIGNPLKSDPTYALAFAETEARDVVRMVPNSTLLIGSQATIAAFKTDAPGHDVIHFAGHGEFVIDQPLQSRLLFAAPSGGVDSLTAQQIYDIRTSASLVFLSACETGLNRIAQGEEIMGLERAFFFSGAGSVIASLWSVNDQATAALVHAFYQAWIADGAADEALRRAQIATRAQFPHPWFWAAFQIAGGG